MKILLSAYACEPNKGSEPGVGWTWVSELAKKDDVWVLTRDNNRPTIESYLMEHPDAAANAAHFIYIGLPKSLTFWKKGRRGMRLYYSMWQRKAAKVAGRLQKQEQFDYVQHITFVSYTQQSYLYRLNIPIVWGPIAGGENIPNTVRIPMSFKERIVERVRKISQRICLYAPCTQRMLKDSTLIFAATEETKSVIPQKYAFKVHLLPAIALENKSQLTSQTKDERIKIVMAGRLIYWKAFHLGIAAFLSIVKNFPNIELHILGEGNKKKELMMMCGEYLNNQIFFDEPVPHDDIYKYYSSFDIFMNTTLRDSGCMTMMEAMSVGLPCIAVDVGGPGMLLRNFPECKIRPDSNLVQNLSDLLKILVLDSEKRNALGKAQKEYAGRELHIQYSVGVVQRLLEDKLKEGGLDYGC